MTIWKFPFEVQDRVTIQMPRGAVILAIQTQGEVNPCMWALVEESAPIEVRTFRVFGKGHPIHTGLTLGRLAITHVGTAQMLGGSLVFHIFETNEVGE